MRAPRSGYGQRAWSYQEIERLVAGMPRAVWRRMTKSEPLDLDGFASHNANAITFEVMMRPSMITHSGAFFDEELASIERFMMASVRTLVAIGDATFAHLQTAKRHGVSYIAVDPQDGPDRTDMGPRRLRKSFEQLELDDLPSGPRGFLFSFNLYSYLDRPLGKLYSLLQPGDMVCASTWTPGAKARLGYMDALRRTLGRPLPELDSDPHADFTHICALLPARTAPWQQINLVSTQTIFRYPE